uniref:hypothetical protein n=1 Tax=Armatimonas sp. TaxID=1872638 RepID=UPI0037535372
PDKRLTLAVDGQQVAAGPLHSFITSDPSNPMELGGDAGSKVSGKDLPNFVGTLTRVRLYSGRFR